MRIAFVFRWLSKAHKFMPDAAPPHRHAMAVTLELMEVHERRDRERREKAAREAKAETARVRARMEVAPRLRPREQYASRLRERAPGASDGQAKRRKK